MLTFVVSLVVLHFILKQIPASRILHPSETRIRREKLAKLRHQASTATNASADQRTLMTLRSQIFELETVEKKENASYLWILWALYNAVKYTSSFWYGRSPTMILPKGAFPSLVEYTLSLPSARGDGAVAMGVTFFFCEVVIDKTVSLLSECFT